jgi:hypothetical protein
MTTWNVGSKPGMPDVSGSGPDAHASAVPTIAAIAMAEPRATNGRFELLRFTELVTCPVIDVESVLFE